MRSRICAREAGALKECVADLTLENRLLKKSILADGGPEALEDRPSVPSRVWNRIPAEVQDQIIELALDQSELSPRELAVRFTDEQRYFVSEATVYRLLKAHDPITS